MNPLLGECSTRWQDEIPIDQYHGDKTHVSSTSLKEILKSPAAFHDSWHGEPWPETKALRTGKCFHEAMERVYQNQESIFVMPKFGRQDVQKNIDAKDSWLAEHAGKFVVGEDIYDDIRYMLDSVGKNKIARALLSRGQYEISGYYKDPTTEINCRIRPDFINWNYGTIVDFKTCQLANEEAFSRSIYQYNYHLSAYMYMFGYEQIHKIKAERFVWLAVESSRPYECALYSMSDHVKDPFETQMMFKQGGRDYDEALRRLKECLVKNEWPQAQTRIKSIGLPRWAYKNPTFE